MHFEGKSGGWLVGCAFQPLLEISFLPSPLSCCVSLLPLVLISSPLFLSHIFLPLIIRARKHVYGAKEEEERTDLSRTVMQKSCQFCFWRVSQRTHTHPAAGSGQKAKRNFTLRYKSGGRKTMSSLGQKPPAHYLRGRPVNKAIARIRTQ